MHLGNPAADVGVLNPQQFYTGLGRVLLQFLEIQGVQLNRALREALFHADVFEVLLDQTFVRAHRQSPPGRPKATEAPSGGSVLHEVKSVGVIHS
jgi:hypothetical protein